MSFDPSSISWTIRVNAASAFKDTALTTPAVADGDIVQGLKRVGSSSIDFNTASSASGPKFRLNKAGGKACIYFDLATPCTLGHADDSTLEALQSGDYTFYFICRPMNVASFSAYSTILAKCTSLGSARIGYMFNGEAFANFASLSDGNVSASTKGQQGTTSYRLQAVCETFQASNSQETIYRRGILSARSTSGTQALDTTNPLTIGGISGTTSYAFAGEFYELFAIGRLLTDTERINMDNYAASTYGIGSGVVLFSGNSMVWGSGATPGTNDPVTLTQPYLGNDIAVINNGVPSEQTPAMTTLDASLYTPSFTSAILQPLAEVGWEIYNDINVGGSNAATAYAHIVAWAQQSRSAGCKGIVVCSPMPSGANETVRQAVRTLLAADFTVPTGNPNVFLAKPGGNGYADVYCDVGNDYFLGPAGTNSNTTYYNSDHIHPNAAGNAILAPTFAYAIRQAAGIALIASGGGGGSGFVRPGMF